jgi:hypothetical protein
LQAKKAHQAVKVAARVAVEMVLEMHANANTQLGISPFVVEAMLLLKRESIIGRN